MLSGLYISSKVWEIIDTTKSFRCYDGCRERGLLDGSVLAYEMNLAPLTGHGYPVRATGLMNPKWITEIELGGKVYEGYGLEMDGLT